MSEFGSPESQEVNVEQFERQGRIKKHLQEVMFSGNKLSEIKSEMADVLKGL